MGRLSKSIEGVLRHVRQTVCEAAEEVRGELREVRFALTTLGGHIADMTDQITRLDADVAALKDIANTAVGVINTTTAALIAANQKNAELIAQGGTPNVDITPELNTIEASIADLKASVAAVTTTAPPVDGGSTGPLPPTTPATDANPPAASAGAAPSV